MHPESESIFLPKRRSTAGLICKIAFRTIPRLGILSLVLLTISFYFLFSAGNGFLQIHREQNTPYELTAIASSSNIESDRLLQIKGVERVSPVLRFEAELEHQGYQVSTQVKAVYSMYPRFHNIQGVIYPDNSNMPYLILNKAAANSFSRDDDEITLRENDTISMTVSGQPQTAIVCGIYDDGSSEPCAFMSYDTARRLWGSDKAPEILITLSNAGAAPKAVLALQRYHLTANYDSDTNRGWDLLHKQTFQSVLVGFLLCLSAAGLVREKGNAEKQMQRQEMLALQTCGLTAAETARIYPLRICLAEFGCLTTATIAAASNGVFTLYSIPVCLLMGSVLLLCLTGDN